MAVPKDKVKEAEKKSQTFSFGKGGFSQFLDIISKFKFDIEIVGVGALKARSVQIPTATISSVSYREGHEPTYDRKFSGNLSWGPLVVDKAVSEYAIVDGPILDWFNLVINKGSEADGARKTIIVMVKSSAINKDSSDIKRKFVFYNAFPTEVSHEALDATDSGILMFQASFSFDRMETYTS